MSWSEQSRIPMPDGRTAVSFIEDADDDGAKVWAFNSRVDSKCVAAEILCVGASIVTEVTAADRTMLVRMEHNANEYMMSASANSDANATIEASESVDMHWSVGGSSTKADTPASGPMTRTYGISPGLFLTTDSSIKFDLENAQSAAAGDNMHVTVMVACQMSA